MLTILMGGAVITGLILSRFNRKAAGNLCCAILFADCIGMAAGKIDAISFYLILAGLAVTWWAYRAGHG